MSFEKLIVLIAVSSLLAACNFTSPSELDLQNAEKKDLKVWAEQTNLQLKQLQAFTQVFKVDGTMWDAWGGPIKKLLDASGARQITQEDLDRIKVRKIGCKDDGENAAMCDIEIKYPQETGTRRIRMVKSSQGWVEQ